MSPLALPTFLDENNPEFSYSTEKHFLTGIIMKGRHINLVMGTTQINAIGPDGLSNKQTVNGFSYSKGTFSLRMENDFLALQGHDRWRSNAVELVFGDVVVGTTLYNNYVDKRKGDLVDKSGSYSHHNGKFGRWVDGQTYNSPLYLGFRTGNNVSRLGYSHKVFQHAFQNIFTHKSGFAGIMPFGHANYFLGYDNFYTGPYSYSGYYNPYSLWGR